MREDSKKVEVKPPGGGLAPGQRWSAARKREVVLRMLQGDGMYVFASSRRADQSEKIGAARRIF